MHCDVTRFHSSYERSMLVLTCVDGALRETAAGSCLSARDALRAVTLRGVPIVLTSHHGPGELVRLQQQLGLREPFIAETGARLYVPRGYFTRLPGLTAGTDDWAVFEFTPPSVEEAIETLMWLYRVSGESPLLVGVGASWSDRSLLRHVDVPVVIRNPAIDQRQLRARFPDAYVTRSAGPRGWTEAILGAGWDTPAMSDPGEGDLALQH